MSDLGQNAGYHSDADADAAPPWRERKNLMLAGAVGAAAVVGLLGYFLVFSGGSSDDTGGLVAGAHSNTTVVVPSAAPSTLPPVYKADPYGNPFKPIYAAAPAVVASTPAAPDTAAATTTDTGSSTSTGSGSAAVDTPTTTKTVSIKLVKVVDAGTVVTSVNGGAAATHSTGDVFSDVFSLLSAKTGAKEATFKYGDGAAFTLSVGQTNKFVVTS